MIIRKAELKDIDGVFELVKEFFKESLSEYGLKLEEKTIKETLENYIQDLIGIVAEENGKIIGAIGGLVSPSIFDKSQLVGQETIWFVNGEKRKGRVGIELINAFEKECKLRGAHLIAMVHMGNLNGDILDRYYKKRNYNLLERQYIKGV